MLRKVMPSPKSMRYQFINPRLVTKPLTLPQLHDNNDPFTTTLLREKGKSLTEITLVLTQDSHFISFFATLPKCETKIGQNLRAKSAHRRIASEGDSSPYFIGQEPKPYIQFTITPVRIHIINTQWSETHDEAATI